MLQEFPNAPPTTPGGINLTFMCDDAIALYHKYGPLGASEPEVGNGLWVTQVTDPDGFKLFFESPTDVAEDTKLSEMK
ncbi:MAG: lactoylglutathione lyase [Thermoanaerobaculia bacterium]|nr:lactoylglutathione lyase [Thermoanaerobaculia bacterium]